MTLTVKSWILHTQQKYACIHGPTKVFQLSKWGIAAEFVLKICEDTNTFDLQKIVIFKANFNPNEADVGAIYKLLNNYCEENIPVLLAAKSQNQEQWSSLV